MLLLKLAWRNIWRNTRRTLITLVALSAGVMAIITLHSFREVANEAMIVGITEGLIGHAQVHGRGYQSSPEMSNVVPDPVAVEARLSSAIPGARAERRVLGAGLAGSGEAATAVMVMGLDAASADGQASLTVKSGRALAAAPAREAVVGTGLAQELRLSPGAELVLVSQAADGSLANDRFTVVGSADAGSAEANQSTVFLHLADAQSFFALGQGVHQVIVRLPGAENEDLTGPVSLLRGALDLSALEVLPWTEILPELKGALDAKRKNMGVMDFIIFLIVALGVFNTMSMSTFERTREFGVMASLGTRRGRILGMVALEAALQGMLGFLLGLALAWLVLHGIGTADFSSWGGGDVMGARLPDKIALVVHLPAVKSAAITAGLTMLAGALVPAIRASRLKPVEATRYV